jgi:hypothetical protein
MNVLRGSSISAALFLAGAPLVIAGCEAEDGDAVGSAVEEIVTANALTANALTANALTANALTANALTANALTANALTANALTANALATDAGARTVLKYVVGCALPAGVHFDLVLDGVTCAYDGQIGLAPAWGNPGGHCDAACRTWVSGCVLSRLNYVGQSVAISVRGAAAALAAPSAEQLAYPHREATYFGDVFASPQVRLLCLPSGATADPRVCGPSLAGCAVTTVGFCEGACGAPRADGSFPECHDRLRTEAGSFPAGTTAFTGSVSVFLP